MILASETWLKSDIHDTEIIPADFGFELFRNDRSDGYGGVLIAVKCTLIYELTTVGKECKIHSCEDNLQVQLAHSGFPLQTHR